MALSLKPGSPEVDGTQNPQTAQGTYSSSVAVSLNIIAVIAVCVALYLGQSFFLPIALSIITALTLARWCLPPGACFIYQALFQQHCFL